jgi:O-antigen/teichoic acid export membrane protein
MVFAQPLIEILFTSKFSEASNILRVYAFTYLVMGIPHDVGFRSLGNSSWILKTQIGFSVLSLLAVFVATQFYGINGTLWATIFAQALLKVYGLSSLKKHIFFRWRELIPYKEWSLFLGTSIGLAVVSLLLRPLFSGPLTWFACCGPFFTLIYLIIIYYWGDGALTRSWILLSQKSKKQ